MRIFVFGATGFLGRSLTLRLLELGHDVSLLTRNYSRAFSLFGEHVDIVEGDMVTFNESLSAFDAVINCSGEVRDKAQMYELHVNALKRILLSLESGGPHWVQVSSVGVYGPGCRGEVFEEHSFSPIGEYEVTKAMADKLVRDVCLERKTPFTILRPSNVFGEGMPNSSLKQLVEMIRRGVFFHVDDPEKSMMNYVYIEDVVEAIIYILRVSDARNDDFIISDVVDQASFVALIKEELGGGWSPVVPKWITSIVSRVGDYIPRFPLSRSRVAALSVRCVYSSEKIKRVLSFEYPVGCVEGLRRYCRSIANSN
jgi:nucleoside-diphosphate-sugar epimerase